MIRLAAFLILAAQIAAADGLLGRDVTFGALAYEEREAPIFVGARHPAKVSGAIEYGLGPEGSQNGWDIVPAIIDIRDHQIILTYPPGNEGIFPDLEFNGYVLDFLTECVLFEGAHQDLAQSTVALKEGAIFVEGSKLFVSLSDVVYGPTTFVVVDVEVADCPIG